MRRRAAALAVLGVLVLLLGAAACGNGGTIEVTAVLDDIGDLVPRAAVTVSDVQVGEIARIGRTDDQRALVHLRVDADADLPAALRARLRRTSLLGERFIELVPTEADSTAGPRLADGDRIDDTVIVADLEEVLLAGGDIVAAVSADRLAGGIEGAATALVGREQTLGALLSDLALVADAYAGRSEDIVGTIDDLDAFLADLAPQAELHGEAFGELRRAASAFEAQDERLLDALAEVQGLSRSAEDLLRTHRGTLDSALRSLAGIAGEIEARDADVAQLFGLLAIHNDISLRGVNAEQIQVIADVIGCGVNDIPGDPVRSCTAPPQGTQRPPEGRPSPGAPR